MKLPLVILGILTILVVSGCTQTGQVIGNDNAACDSCCPEVNDTTPYASCDSCCPEEEQKALIAAYSYSWGEYSDVSEYYFDVYVYNYGYVEAKNMRVTCKVYDFFTDNVVFTTTEDIGNLASTTSNYYLIEATKTVETGDDDYSICEVTSCTDCMVLDDRLA